MEGSIVGDVEVNVEELIFGPSPLIIEETPFFFVVVVQKGRSFRPLVFVFRQTISVLVIHIHQIQIFIILSTQQIMLK